MTILKKIKQKLCKHQYHDGRPITLDEQCSNDKLTADFNVFCHACELCNRNYLSLQIVVSENNGTFSVRNNIPIVEILLLPVPVYDHRPYALCTLENSSAYLVKCASCNKYNISEEALSGHRSFMYLCDNCRHLCIGYADSIYKTKRQFSAKSLHELMYFDCNTNEFV